MRAVLFLWVLFVTVVAVVGGVMIGSFMPTQHFYSPKNSLGLIGQVIALYSYALVFLEYALSNIFIVLLGIIGLSYLGLFTSALKFLKSCFSCFDLLQTIIFVAVNEFLMGLCLGSGRFLLPTVHICMALIAVWKDFLRRDNNSIIEVIVKMVTWPAAAIAVSGLTGSTFLLCPLPCSSSTPLFLPLSPFSLPSLTFANYSVFNQRC